MTTRQPRGSGVSEAALMGLCDAHYAHTGRIVTVIAVPLGAIDRLWADVSAGWRFCPVGQRLVLYTPEEVVSLEEMSVPEPTVLSDRAR